MPYIFIGFYFNVTAEQARDPHTLLTALQQQLHAAAAANSDNIFSSLFWRLRLLLKTCITHVAGTFEQINSLYELQRLGDKIAVVISDLKKETKPFLVIDLEDCAHAIGLGEAAAVAVAAAVEDTPEGTFKLICVCMCVCVFVYMCICTCVCVCMCAYAHIRVYVYVSMRVNI